MVSNSAETSDDLYCSCAPSATGSASKNNNNKPLSPYLVSVATSPRKKHTKTVMTSLGQETQKTLPPLDINRTILHHHSTRRSARKSSRGHTVPVMLATKNPNLSSKRSHSAASTEKESTEKLPSTPESNGRRSRQNHRSHTSSPERKSSKVLCSTPEKQSRRLLNKIETVRILRARPAFYPIHKEKMASNKSSARSVRDFIDGATASPGQEYMDLPHNILGKHITLRMDRSELKRKRGRNLAALPPSTHLT